VMAGVLLSITPAMHWWISPGHNMLKIAYILGICAAGALSYFAALFAAGFRLREIRHH
jgi:putative peptidoglycan lipid II flippase